MVWKSLSRRKKTGNYGRQMTIKQDNDTVGSYFLLKKVNIHFETAHTSEMRRTRARERVGSLNETMENVMFPPLGRWEESGDTSFKTRTRRGVVFTTFCINSLLQMRNAAFLFSFKNNLCGTIDTVEQGVNAFCIKPVQHPSVEAFTCQTKAYWLMTRKPFYMSNLFFLHSSFMPERQERWLPLKKAAGIQRVDVYEAWRKHILLYRASMEMSINYWVESLTLNSLSACSSHSIV